MKPGIAALIALATTLGVHAQTPTPAKPPTSAEALYRQGIAAEKAGDPAAARKAYTEALRAQPQHPHARYRLEQLKLTAPKIAAKGYEARIGSVVVPELKLDNASLGESLDALAAIIRKQSADQVSPNFIVQDPGQRLQGAKISLNLKNLPAKAALQYLLDQAGAKANYDEHAVVVTPR